MQEQVVSHSPVMAAYHDEVQKMNHARDAFRACKGRMQTMEKAAQAAQAEADAAKAEWRALLREGDGTLSKEAQRLRAAERSAYTLQEEYQELVKEMQPIFAARNVELVTVASSCMNLRAAAIKEMAQAALAEIIARHGAEIRRAMSLHVNAIAAGDARLPWRFQELSSNHGPLHGEASSQFMECLKDGLMKLEPAAMEVEMELDLSDVDMDLVRSPAKRNIAMKVANGK